MNLVAGFSKVLTGQYLSPKHKKITTLHHCYTRYPTRIAVHCGKVPHPLLMSTQYGLQQHGKSTVPAFIQTPCVRCLSRLGGRCSERRSFGEAALGSCCGQHKSSRKPGPSGAAALLLWRPWVLDGRGAAAWARARCWRPLGGGTCLQGWGPLLLKRSCWERWWVLHCTQALRNVFLRHFWAVVPLPKTVP